MFSCALRYGGVLVTLCLFGTGCAAPATRSAAPPPSDVPTVQRSATFAGVSAAYRSRNYGEAIKRIRSLSRNPDLSPADRLFLSRQETICREAISNRSGAIPEPRTEPPTVDSQPSPVVADCGPRALHLVCGELGIPASLPALTKAAGTDPGVGSNLLGLSRAAQSVGLSARGVQVDADALRRAPTPALAWVDGDHFVAVTRIGG
ncbi:MAG: hypothetical protein H7145_10475, partial [Akkermansiaceae bacterium]|nr:hypothetical protein [Armatimonadota bacterium]